MVKIWLGNYISEASFEIYCMQGAIKLIKNRIPTRSENDKLHDKKKFAEH